MARPALSERQNKNRAAGKQPEAPQLERKMGRVCATGSGGPGEACQGAAAAAAPQGTARPLPAALSLPPPACLSGQLPKAGPGSRAGRELLGS